MRIAIVEINGLKIASWYDADNANQDGSKYGGPWGDPEVTKHVALLGELDEACVVAQMQPQKWTKDGENNISDANDLPLDWQIEGWEHVPAQFTLVEDTSLVIAKTQAERDNKLANLRVLRDKELNHADDERKKHEDSDPNAVATAAEWSAHRIELRDLTDSYKEENGDGSDALDAYASDMSDFDAWPVKPS